MRIFLKKTCAGPQGSFLGEREYAVPGQMPRDLADSLLAGGYADLRGEEVPAEPPAPEVPVVPAGVEAAVEAPASENAAERTGPPSKRSRRGRQGGP